MTALPVGFSSFVTNIGIKDGTDDFAIVAADGPCVAAGVFTQSSFAGPSVLVLTTPTQIESARAVGDQSVWRVLAPGIPVTGVSLERHVPPQ